MSYDISFRVKAEGVDEYITVGNYSANITWNVRKMIEVSTGLPWENEANNGLCVDIIPKIINGYKELLFYPEKYKQYEAKNGWGTVRGTTGFFKQIIDNWEDFCAEYENLVPVATFWIT